MHQKCNIYFFIHQHTIVSKHPAVNIIINEILVICMRYQWWQPATELEVITQRIIDKDETSKDTEEKDK